MNELIEIVKSLSTFYPEISHVATYEEPTPDPDITKVLVQQQKMVDKQKIKSKFNDIRRHFDQQKKEETEMDKAREQAYANQGGQSVKMSKIARLFLDLYFEKEAGSKWREMLRAGQLSDDALGVLRGLTTQSKELAGLQKGTEALMKRHGITEASPLKQRLFSLISPSPMMSVEGLPYLSGLKKMTKKLKGKTLKKEYVPGDADALISSMGKNVSPENKEILKAIFKRHEVDEAIAALRGEKHLQKRLNALSQEAGAGTRQAIKGLKGLDPNKIKEGLKRYAKAQGEGLVRGQYVNKPQFASHISPEVIAQEAGHVSVFGPDIQSLMKSPLDTGIQGKLLKKIRSLSPEADEILGAMQPKHLRAVEESVLPELYGTSYRQAYSALPKTKKWFGSDSRTVNQMADYIRDL